VDETDYEEAQITLNNSIAQLHQATQNILPQYAGLKRIMGLPPEKQFNVKFDTLQLMQAIHIDTNQQLQFENRIEFQQSKIAKQLQEQQVKYYQRSFIPTVSAFYNYNLAYQNNVFPQLFSTSYPSSYFGLTLNVPIFTGFSRVRNLQKARLEEQVIDYKITDLKSIINTDYNSALANYKSNLFSLKLLQKNVDLAKRTYFVVTLQYKQGVIPYLNVITAESNLINAQINYLNTLFQVLSSKIDLQRAMGSITY
jgi:outer membrane protein TolC